MSRSIHPLSESHSSWPCIEYWSPWETKTSNLSWSTCLSVLFLFRTNAAQRLCYSSCQMGNKHSRDLTSCNPTLPLEFYIHRSGYLPSRELRLSATRPRPRRRTGSQHLSVARRKTRGVQEFRPHLHLPWAALKQVLERAGLHAYARHDISCRFCAPYRL